jgi:hypothetical protein
MFLYKLNSYILFLLFVSATFSVPISHFFGVKLYALFAAMFWISSLLVFIKEFPLKHNLRALVIVAFLIIFIPIIIVSSIMNGIYNSLLGTSLYVIYLIPITLLSSCSIYISNTNHTSLVKCNTMFAIVIGLFGYYQLHIDSTMFGMYSDGAFSSYEFWSVKRAASLLASIQVFSAYMLFSILAIFVFKPFSARPNLLFMLLIFLGGISGGSQTFFFLSTIMVLMFVFQTQKKPEIMMLSAFTVVLLFTSSNSFLNMDSLERVLKILTMGFDYFLGMNQERWSIWSGVIEETPFIFGNGIGSASVAVSGAERYNTESFILNAYYEGGIVLVLFYIILFLTLILNARISSFNKIIVGLVFFLYAVTVHVFFSVALIFPWIFLLAISSHQHDASPLIKTIAIK